MFTDKIFSKQYSYLENLENLNINSCLKNIIHLDIRGDIFADLIFAKGYSCLNHLDELHAEPSLIKKINSKNLSDYPCLRGMDI